MPIGRQHRHGGSHGNVTTWQLYWPGGATPRSPPVAGAPVSSSGELGRVGPGERPPGAPRWPTPPFLRHGSLAVLARGSDPPEPPVTGAPVPSSRELGRVGPGEQPPEPPGDRRPRSFVTGAWPCWPGGATPGFRGL